MKLKATILTTAAVLAMIGVTGCFSQQKKAAATPIQNSGSSSAHPVSVNWSGTHPEQVSDPGLRMPAYTIQVPNGWKFVGTILRPTGCHAPAVPAAGLSYTSLSPDGVSAFMVLPGSSWTWTSTGQSLTGPRCAAININTAAGFLVNIVVPNLHPNAKIIAILAPNKATQEGVNQMQQRAQEQNNAMARSYGQRPQHIIQDLAQVHIEYQENGRDVEELIGNLIYCNESQTVATYGQPSRTQRSCYSYGTNITRAPKGSLAALLAQPRPDSQVNRAWDNQVAHNIQAGTAQLIKASNDNFNALMANMKAQGDARTRQAENFRAQQQTSFEHAQQNDRAAQAAIDHSAHQMELYSLDRQTFINPSTGQKIEASDQFNHQWISSDGQSVIQNNDPTFDPNGVVDPIKQSWTELIPAR